MSEPSAGMMVTSNVRLVRPLGEGGMGRVWVAEHLSLHTSVVVKFMARDLLASPEAIARFSREAAAASQVKSPHVVQMFDHGVVGEGTPYIVMELLEGRDLEQHLRARGRLPPREVVAVVAQLARALVKAHERGIVHRDIKPSNVFLLDAGGGELFVKLLDFGIAKGPEVGVLGSTTRTGTFVGSPYYMSPEQVVGAKSIDFRTDLWSLGVVAYEALVGERPFNAETMGALALKIHRDPLPVPSQANPALGPAIDAWFAKACAREPGERFASAKDMAEALAVALTGEAIPPGLHVDSVPSPERGAAREPTHADARSETGAGVDLVTTGHRSAAARHRWWMAAAVGVVAVGVGFVVPRLASKKRDIAPPAMGAGVNAAAMQTLTPMPTPTPISPPISPPSSTPASTSTPPSTPASTSLPPFKRRPAPSAVPSLPSAAPVASARRPAPSDDDIK